MERQALLKIEELFTDSQFIHIFLLLFLVAIKIFSSCVIVILLF